jgi:hypothetical protein
MGWMDRRPPPLLLLVDLRVIAKMAKCADLLHSVDSTPTIGFLFVGLLWLTLKHCSVHGCINELAA